MYAYNRDGPQHVTDQSQNVTTQSQKFMNQNIMSKPSTRSDFHLDEATAAAQQVNLSSSVGKPAYGQGQGAYGLSAGPGATRKLDFVGDNKHP